MECEAFLQALGKHRLLCDVGCGGGVLLEALLRRLGKGARGVQYDRAGVMAAYQAPEDLEGRVQTATGDFFKVNCGRQTEAGRRAAAYQTGRRQHGSINRC